MTAKLSLLVPIAITDAMFISSTVAENDYAAYSSGTTYAVGDRCISTVTHRIYESLRASNIGHDPTDVTNRAGTSPWWQDVSATNKWAMLDDQVSTPTVAPLSLTFVLRPGAFNSIYLAGLYATTVVITVKDAPGGTVIYSHTNTLEGSQPADYYEYWFEPFRPQTDYLTSGLEPYSTMEVTVQLSSPSGDVKCGMVSLGDLRPLGATQRGAKAKPKTYSYIKTDDFGNATIKRRKSARDLSASALIDIADVNMVLDLLTSVLDVPCVVIGSDTDEFSGLRTFGLVSGEVSYDSAGNATLSITVNGMI
jgi:hypothetical protein